MVDKMIAAIEERKKKVQKNVSLNTHGDIHQEMKWAAVPYDCCIEIIRDIASKQSGWIPVKERLPTEAEALRDDCAGKYYARFEVAVMTDTIEYYFAYYDGDKWFDSRHSTFNRVVAWKIHEPYKQEDVSDA